MDIQMIGVLWLIGAFFLGLLNCFFGYRLFIVTVAIVGFLLGASLGYMLGNFVGSGIAGLIAAAVLGLIGAWASVSAYYAFVFVAGAFGFALLAAFVAGLFGSDVHVAVPIVAGLIGGFLALWLQRVVIILRSEEHTSELQSHSFTSYAVFCLKKKKKNKTIISTPY